MSRIFRRSMAILRRPNRRFNTTQQGPAEGGGVPPPHGEYKWNRRFHGWEAHYKNHPWGHGRHCGPWGYRGHWGRRGYFGCKAPLLILGGFAIWYFTRPSDESRRRDESNEHIQQEFQDETRELKQRLALIQQSIDQLKGHQNNHPPVYPHQYPPQ
ncbi:hypothetical protein Ae201684P_006200 [Aphanomyces euteiches]|nr:hypothetical protein Ae201684P_006200 [Aphanomyces euteiches]